MKLSNSLLLFFGLAHLIKF